LKEKIKKTRGTPLFLGFTKDHILKDGVYLLKMKIKKKLLLTIKDIKPSFKDLEVRGVLNPAAIRLPNKKIVLYVRIIESPKHKDKTGVICPVIRSEMRQKIFYQKIKKDQILKRNKGMVFLKDGTCRLTTISHLRRVVLDESGFNVEKICDDLNFVGKSGESEYGVEDPRITKIGAVYYMTYVGVSKYDGISTYLASSKDLKKWKRLGLIFREQNKDVVLFPEKIKGKYVALNRPETQFEFSKPGIWISYSPDLDFWGQDKHLIKPILNSWESERVGSGCPPIKTKKGWLMIYHGVELKRGKNIYSAGGVLLDLKNPSNLIARSPSTKPLFKPTDKEDKLGFVNNVVFPTGAVMDLNGEDLLIYSGGADSNINVRKIKLKDILDSLHSYKSRGV